jgi:hypothetical protein
MKKLLMTIVAVLVSASAFAQGTIIFDNRPQSGVAPIFAPDGVAGAGSIPGMIGELDLVNGTGASATYTPVGTSPFRGTSGAVSEFIATTELTVPGVPPNGSGTFVVRAYNGSSYDASAAIGSGKYFGQSLPITVSGLGGQPASGPPIPSPDLSGLQGFNVALSTPEPSTIALGVLGAAALLLRRRKS